MGSSHFHPEKNCLTISRISMSLDLHFAHLSVGRALTIEATIGHLVPRQPSPSESPHSASDATLPFEL
jgi:hypothetical protein